MPNKAKGVITSLLKKNQKQNKSYITKSDDGKKSELEYELIKKLQNYFLIIDLFHYEKYRRLLIFSFYISFSNFFILSIKISILSIGRALYSEAL